MKKIMPIICVTGLLLLQGCVSPQSRRQNFVDQHPNLAPDVTAAILEGKIAKGMTADAVKASWGTPDQTTISVSDRDMTETWSYNTPVGQFAEGVVILTFSEGKLINLVH